MLKPSRNVAKVITRIVVHSTAIQVSTAVIDTVVDPQTETAQEAVDVSGFVVGTVIAVALRKRTVEMVDRVADWNIARKAKKSNTTE